MTGTANHAEDQGNSHFPYFRTLVDLARETHPESEPFSILEVGTWAGQSLIAWAHAAPGAYLTVVDPWQPYMPDGPYPHYAVMNTAAASGEIETLFWNNIQKAGLDRSRITIWKKNSVEWLPKLVPGFDIVFIDGDHRYSVVSEDILNAIRLVRYGGILCGDDLDVQLDELAPGEHIDGETVDLEVATTIRGRTYHHGVAQAVYETFGRVTCFENRLWAVKLTDEGWANL